MNPLLNNSSIPKPGRSVYGVATAVVLVLIPVVVVAGGDQVQAFLNFGAGVLSLVCLTCSVIWGLVAQDRLILNTRQRIIAQGIHRVTAVASIAFLLVHITVKIALQHTVLIAAIIPFSLGVTGIGGLIGLGSTAGLLMIFVGITGALRNRFAAPAEVAARWRAMHMLAYPALCAALIHGLFAGRAAKPFFMYSYELCLVGVMAALALRAAPREFKLKIAGQVAAMMGTRDPYGMDDLEMSRSRVAESGPRARGGDAPRGRGGDTGTGSALPGYESRGPRPAASDTMGSPRVSPSPMYGTPAAEPNGYAAAYRAVNTPGQAPAYGADQTARMNLPSDMQATEAMQRMDTGGSVSGNWPVPSPPPVGEAPPSAYDPLQDTGFNIPVYGNPGANGNGARDVYNTGETNAQYATYNGTDTYNSGPANAPSPGMSSDNPGSGEPWNTPSGGYR